MPSNKSKCSKCLCRHAPPPTGKNCKKMLSEDMEEAQCHSLSVSTAASPVKPKSSGEESDVQTQILEQLKRINSRHTEDEVSQVKQHSTKQKKISSLSLANNYHLYKKVTHLLMNLWCLV